MTPFIEVRLVLTIATANSVELFGQDLFYYCTWKRESPS